MDYAISRVRRDYDKLRSYGAIDSEITFEAYLVSQGIGSTNTGAGISIFPWLAIIMDSDVNVQQRLPKPKRCRPN
jgi:hypothetical protein